MVSRKYVQDYRLENILDENGRQKTVTVYRGERFVFVAPPDIIGRMKRIYLCGGVLYALLLVLLLWQSLTVENTMYVVLPLACGCIPCFYLLAGARRLHTAAGSVTREHKDKIHDRLATVSLILTVLTLISLAGSVVYQCVTPVCTVQTVLYSAALLVMTAVCLLLFLLRGNLRMRVSDEKQIST